MKLFIVLVVAALAYSAYSATVEELVAKATELEKKLEEAIASLSPTQVIQKGLLKGEETRLRSVVTLMKSATNEERKKILEKELEAIENAIVEQLKKLEVKGTTAASVFKRAVKEEMVTKVQQAEKEAMAEMEKLTAAGKTSQANALRILNNRLKELLSQYQKSTSESAQTRMEAEMTMEMNRIAQEIRRDEGRTGTPGTRGTNTRPTGGPTRRPTGTTAAPTPTGSLFKRAVKEEMVTKVQQAEKECTAEIEKLTAAGKTPQANALKILNNRLKELLSQYQKSTSESAQTRMEAEMTMEMRRMQEEINRDEHRTGTPGTRPTVPTRKSTGTRPTTEATTKA